MTKERIVTRFPPSPTGYLHIGGARTALYNWLFAKQRGGKFILRIEDTDKVRSTEESIKAILESFEWLGLDWDEGPYFQSERYSIYNEFIERLLTEERAYHCHCTPEELDQKRKEAMDKELKPKYDGKCRNLGLEQKPGSVVRLKTPLTGNTQFNDLIKGPISFNNEELDDLIARYADNWALDRMPLLDRNIIRISLYEMLHEEDIPYSVSINEAVELAKVFGTEDSGKFVNGILGKIASELQTSKTKKSI